MKNKKLAKIIAKIVLSVVVLISGAFAWFFANLGPALGGGTELTAAEKFYENIWIIGIVGIFLIFNKHELSRRTGYCVLGGYAALLVVGYVKG